VQLITGWSEGGYFVLGFAFFVDRYFQVMGDG